MTAPFTRLRRGRGITTGVALAVLAAGLTSVSVATPAMANVSSFCTSVGGAQVGATNDCLVSFTTTGSSTWTVPAGITSIRYLVVGGGGGGQNGRGGAGAPYISNGGAGGGTRPASGVTVTDSATLTITVGAGGGVGANGGASSITGGGVAGATAAGGLTSQVSGAGSNGASNDITGASVIYGSSGGGTGSAGGSGAGNGAATNSGASGGSGVANRGGGGGAGASFDLFGSWSATGGGAGGSGVVFIRFTAAVAPSAGTSTAPSGTAELNGTLAAATTFTGLPTPTRAHEWEYSPDGTTWATIPGATAASYSPTADQVGGYLRVKTTATNTSGTASDTSPSVGPVGMATPGAPSLAASSDTGDDSTDSLTSATAPELTISGLTAGASVTVSATNGTDTRTCTFLAAGSSGGCALSGLTDGTWTTSATQTLNGMTSAATAGPAIDVDTTAPTPPTAPTITPSGGTVVPNTVTATTTGLTLSAPITAGEASGGKARFFLDGVLLGEDGTIAPGDTSVSLSFASSAAIQAAIAAGGDLTVELFDAAGNASTSLSTPLAVDYSVPSVSAFAPAAGQAVNAATMPMDFDLTMSEAITGLDASDFTNAGTATGCVFTPDPTSGTTFRVSVTGCSGGTVQPQLTSGTITDGVNPGPAVNSSSTSGVNFIAAAPAGTGAPALSATSGTLTTLGSTLSSTAGTWDDQGDSSPATSYRWQACTTSDPASCTDISGATASTFTPGSTYLGQYVRAIVTRSNAAGSSAQESSLTGPLAKAPQSITFADPADRAYTPVAFSVTATASSGLTVALASTDPTVCTVTGLDVTLLRSGTCTLVASQPGSDVFDPATPVSHSFVIAKATDAGSTTSASPVSAAPGQTVALTTTSGSSGQPVYAVVSGPCTIVGSTLTATGAGDCVVSTAVPADDRYDASTPPNITVPVRIVDAVSLAAVPDQLLSAGSFTPATTSTSGRTPTVAAGPAGVCAMSAGDVTLIGPGTCTVTGSLTDDGSHAAAATTMTFAVVAPPTAPVVDQIKTAAADGVLGGSAEVSFTAGPLNGSQFVGYEITATPTGGGAPVTVSCSASPCTIAGLDDVPYDFTVTARADALGTPVSSTSVTSQATPLALHLITLSSPGPQLFGSRLIPVSTSSQADPSWSPSVTSSTPSVCTVSGTTVTPVALGTCTLVAEHTGGVAGSTTYGLGRSTVSFALYTPIPVAASSPTTVVATAGPGSVTVSWGAPSSSGSYPITHYKVVSSTGQVCLTTTLSCTFAPVPVGGPYTYTVSALTGAGWGAASDPVTVSVAAPAPVKPSTTLFQGKRTADGTLDRITTSGRAVGIPAGSRVTPWIRLEGSQTFQQGVATIVVGADGTFTWSRKIRKDRTFTAYVALEDLQSNVVTWRRVR